MGCKLGSLFKGSDTKPKSKKSEADDDVRPVVPVLHLPLTARQKYSMVASWKGISRAMESTGVHMFLK
jgi:hypothetical protein